MQQGTTKGHAAGKPNDESLIVLQRSKLKETHNYSALPHRGSCLHEPPPTITPVCVCFVT